MKKSLSLFPLLISGLLFADNHPNLQHFPLVQGDKIRSVIVLEKKENESDYKVELLVGEMQLTDGVTL